MIFHFSRLSLFLLFDVVHKTRFLTWGFDWGKVTASQAAGDSDSRLRKVRGKKKVKNFPSPSKEQCESAQ